MSDTDYIDDNEDEELPAGTEGDDADEAGPSDEDDAPAAAQGDDADEKPARKPSRKERQAERVNGYKALQAELAAQRARSEALERQIAASVDATRRVAEGFRDAQRPAPEPPEGRMAKKLAEAAARLDKDRPETVEEYHRVQAAAMLEAAREAAAESTREAEERLKQSLPRQQTAEERRLLNIAPWLTDDVNANGVMARFDALGRKNGIDVRRLQVGDPMRVKLMNNAIADWAAYAELEVNLPRKNGANPGAVSGAGARSFSGGAAGAGPMPVMSEEVKRLADQHPRFQKIKNPEKRHAAYFEQIIKPEMTRR